MAKRPSEGANADRSFRTVNIAELGNNPPAADGPKPEGKSSWGSVRSRQNRGSTVTMTPEELERLMGKAAEMAATENEVAEEPITKEGEVTSLKLGGK